MLLQLKVNILIRRRVLIEGSEAFTCHDNATDLEILFLIIVVHFILNLLSIDLNRAINPHTPDILVFNVEEPVKLIGLLNRERRRWHPSEQGPFRPFLIEAQLSEEILQRALEIPGHARDAVSGPAKDRLETVALLVAWKAAVQFHEQASEIVPAILSFKVELVGAHSPQKANVGVKVAWKARVLRHLAEAAVLVQSAIVRESPPFRAIDVVCIRFIAVFVDQFQLRFGCFEALGLPDPLFFFKCFPSGNRFLPLGFDLVSEIFLLGVLTATLLEI